MAQIIKASGEIVEIEPANGKDFQLKEMQEAVGGYVEVVYLRDGKIMLCNEEGLLIGLPINEKASDLTAARTIVGDVLVCESRQVK